MNNGLAQKIKEHLSKVREGYWYTLHLIAGTTYREYYAKRMNRIVLRNPDWGLNLNKHFQLDYLKKQGLTPESTLLDYGCGALAAGIHFIDYLQPCRYCGLDISVEVLKEGERRLERAALLEQRQPTLYLLDGNLEIVIGDRQFDFIWLQSVFTHMPPDDIVAFLRNIRRHMHPGTKLFTSFVHTLGNPSQKQFKDWYYNEKFFNEAASTLGLDVNFMSDWIHPEGSADIDKMALFTLRGNS